MLAVANVSAGYGAEDVIHDVCFTLETGGRLYIAGPNGCGKTTLLKCVAGLHSCRGSVTVDGREVGSIPKKALARKMGILTQITSVYFPYSIFDTVALGRYAHLNGIFSGITPAERDYVEECIRRVGLADLRNRRISELSGGQLQRVYLARLFAQDPDIVLLDEPTNHLDLKYQIELLQYVTEWSEQEGKSVVGVLHDLNLVHAFAKHVILMYEGGIYAQGTPEEALSGESLKHCYGLDVRDWMKRSLANWVGSGCDESNPNCKQRNTER